MAEFNPYQAWLQVPSSMGETPTYYKLLGLPDFEENPQVISKAAEQQLSRLLAINPEKHRSLWQKLINDLAEAQSTLTHPQHKANYDNRLRGVKAPAAEAPAPQPTSVPQLAAPIPAQPYQATVSTPEQGYPAYGQPAYQNPNYANPIAPQYGQPVYQQPVYGQQPPPAAPPTAAPYAQPYAQPQYGQIPYGQPAYGQDPYAQPVYGQPAQPVYGQPAYGQPVAPAPYSPPAYGQPVYNPAPAQPYGYAQPVAPTYEATAAHDPFQPAGLPNPMAPLGNPDFGNAGPGSYSTAVNPMAPLTSTRSPLPGTSQTFVEENATFGEPISSPNPYRAVKQESPVKYLVMAVLAVVFVIGGFIAKAKMSGSRDDDSVAKTDHAHDTKKVPPQEVVPVSTPAKHTDPKHIDPKHTDPKGTEPHPEPLKPEPAMPMPEPVKPEPVKPEPMKTETLKPVAPMPEMTKPEMTKPEMTKPEMTKPEPAMPEMAKPAPVNPEMAKPEPPKPEPPKPEPPMVASPAEQKEIFKKLAEVRILLGERKFSDAKKELKEVKDLVKTPDMEELYIGMDLVADYSEQFWQAVQQSMRTLKGEIQIGMSLANVVNSEAGEITIRIAGNNKNYKFGSLPPGLALAIANKWFDTKPANKAVLGAFYYVSKTGSIDESRKYWKEAGNGGVDVKYMEKLLDKPAIHGK